MINPLSDNSTMNLSPEEKVLIFINKLGAARTSGPDKKPKAATAPGGKFGSIVGRSFRFLETNNPGIIQLCKGMSRKEMERK